MRKGSDMSVKDLPSVLRPHGLDDVDDDFSLLRGLVKDDWNLFYNFHLWR